MVTRAGLGERTLRLGCRGRIAVVILCALALLGLVPAARADVKQLQQPIHVSDLELRLPTHEAPGTAAQVSAPLPPQ
jgi:hypothetical protein